MGASLRAKVVNGEAKSFRSGLNGREKGRRKVSLTYRVKSAHKVKLTDKQLLQWMFPILLVMLVYMGTWTLSATPTAEIIKDQTGLKFKQCSYNWWDHSLALGEILFLAWGIKVCYNVRNAESLYDEARLISYAIYNIALVNTAMIAFQVSQQALPHHLGVAELRKDIHNGLDRVFGDHSKCLERNYFCKATPDVLVDIDGIVEVKCPAGAANLIPEDARIK
uniref:G-protein coupled receptors family 3 profile domain-containing protein n=1 Tax=Timema cristinae TaxID=61476 RepID=A0A7R9DFZ4_TIMCR|nr:unnamed protein product [Timema cristinae]